MAPRPRIGPLRFLYVGVEDTERAVTHHVEVLGARLRWRFQAFAADVAALELQPGTDDDPSAERPLLLVADHRPAGSVLPIYEIDDLDAAIAAWRTQPVTIEGPLGTPEGDAVVTRDAQGVELAFLHVVRPDALDGAWADEANDRRVR